MVATMVVCSAVTIAAIAVPWVRFAYREPGLHIALETTAALVALLATFLIAGRFFRGGRVDDLLLTAALGILAASNLLFSALPSAFANGHPSSTWLWLSMSGQLLGASALALANVAGPGVVKRPSRRFAQAALASTALVVVVAASASHFAPDVLPVHPPRAGELPAIGHPAVAVIQFATMLAFAGAAIGLIRRRDAINDPMLGWFAAAAIAATFSRLDFFLYPSLYTEWVYVSDIMRLLSYLLLLVGAAHEISSYWQRMSESAVLEERRRMARDLHDGLAQELAYISRVARAPLDNPARLSQIQASADRALDESRRAIAALTRPLDEPLHVVLTQAVEEVAARSGARALIEFDVQADMALDRERRDALVRVTCEAVSNAARHGHAGTIRVELRDSGRAELVVRDDGVGFDPANLDDDAARGFGIEGMRERIEVLGGTFRIASQRGHGTSVEVTIG
jgi:signal transduction histidine kinase